jgi:hypothetical protein
MTKEQALQILKVALDNSIQKGIANNMQEANMIAMAFQTIVTELSKQEVA